MTIKQVLSRAREILATNNIENPSLECELLLRHTLKISRVQLYLELENELGPEEEKVFWQLIKRRLNHEPTAYIMEHREFYGLDFYIEPGVLIPRPETELLVGKAIELVQTQPVSTIADIGTGCGAIAISLALNLPQVKIYATDISTLALKVTLSNCQRHQVVDRICLLEGDMLAPLPEPVDLIIANLPYVMESELPSINTLGFEPLLALNGGSDGLEKIRQLCTQVSNNDGLRTGGSLLLEIGKGQRRALTAFLHALFPSAKIDVVPDLNGIDRMLSLTLQTTKATKVITPVISFS
ncbi:MAG: peptide chain release factor N(5)-glutamine methyltransferase [Dehalococcoidales bacterium]|nr:peptide chain release factor N(5)-glutamine methyltransferase [Dehalococcoidales bacterium]